MSSAVASNRSASRGLAPDPSWPSAAGAGLRESGQVDRGVQATILRQRRRQLPSPAQFLWAGPLRRLERLWRVVMTSSSRPVRRLVDEGFPASGDGEDGVPRGISGPAPITLSAPSGEIPGYSGSGQNRPRTTAARPRGGGPSKEGYRTHRPEQHREVGAKRPQSSRSDGAPTTCRYRTAPDRPRGRRGGWRGPAGAGASDRDAPGGGPGPMEREEPDFVNIIRAIGSAGPVAYTHLDRPFDQPGDWTGRKAEGVDATGLYDSGSQKTYMGTALYRRTRELGWRWQPHFSTAITASGQKFRCTEKILVRCLWEGVHRGVEVIHGPFMSGDTFILGWEASFPFNGASLPANRVALDEPSRAFPQDPPDPTGEGEIPYPRREGELPPRTPQFNSHLFASTYPGLLATRAECVLRYPDHPQFGQCYLRRPKNHDPRRAGNWERCTVQYGEERIPENAPPWTRDKLRAVLHANPLEPWGTEEVERDRAERRSRRMAHLQDPAAPPSYLARELKLREEDILQGRERSRTWDAGRLAVATERVEIPGLTGRWVPVRLGKAGYQRGHQAFVLEDLGGDHDRDWRVHATYFSSFPFRERRSRAKGIRTRPLAPSVWVENGSRVATVIEVGELMAEAADTEAPSEQEAEGMIREDDALIREEEDLRFPPLGPGTMTDPLLTVSLDHLSLADRKEVEKLVREHEAAFSRGDGDLGHYEGFQHDIVLTDPRPFRIPPRRKGPEMAKIEAEEVRAQLQLGIIQPSKSPYSSPSVLVRKKDGRWRFCIDFRRLNEKTLKDAHPLPRIDDLLDTLGDGARWFSSLDLASGYWQIRLAPNAVPYTAFAAAGGLYEYVRLPFGLTNAPACFQAQMLKVLAGHEQYARCYLDDIIIFSKTKEEHLDHLAAILRTCCQHGLKLKGSKCDLMKRELEFLGHLVSEEGIKPTPRLLTAIREYPKPAGFRQLRGFVGLASYYRRFIKDFSGIAAPLTAQANGKGAFVWSPEMEAAYEELRAKLTSPPVLAHPSFNTERPFSLTTDASGTAIGGVLTQLGPDGREHPIGYFSGKLGGCEQRWSATERELWALIKAAQFFRAYLIGPQTKVFVTDHSALKYLQQMKTTNSKLWRWAALLDEFAPFQIVHKPGRDNHVADALSRADQVSRIQVAGEGSLRQLRDVHDAAWWNRVQGEDGELRERRRLVEEAAALDPAQRTDGMRTLLAEYRVFEGVLLQRRRSGEGLPARVGDRIVVPAAAVQDLVERAHGDVVLGHTGAEAIKRRVTAVYACPPGELQDRVEEAAGRCEACLLYKKTGPSLAAPRAPFLDAGDAHHYLPFAVWAVDTVGPMMHSAVQAKEVDLGTGREMQSKGRYQYVVVMIDMVTRWTEVMPLKDKSAKAVAAAIVEKIIYNWGAPRVLLSDQGTEYKNQLLEEICRLTGITHLYTNPRSPWANGLCERTNKTLKDLLGVTSQAVRHRQNAHWPHMLPYVRASLNMGYRAGIGMSPFQYVTGEKPKPPSAELWAQLFLERAGSGVSAEDRAKIADSVREWGRQWAEERQAHAARAQNSKPPTQFQLGDIVYVKQDATGLLPGAKGPFFVWAMDRGQRSVLLQHLAKGLESPMRWESVEFCKAAHFHVGPKGDAAVTGAWGKLWEAARAAVETQTLKARVPPAVGPKDPQAELVPLQLPQARAAPGGYERGTRRSARLLKKATDTGAALQICHRLEDALRADLGPHYDRIRPPEVRGNFRREAGPNRGCGDGRPSSLRREGPSRVGKRFRVHFNLAQSVVREYERDPLEDPDGSVDRGLAWARPPGHEKN